MIKRQLSFICNKTFKEGNTNGLSKKKSRSDSIYKLLEQKHALLDSVIENADGYVWAIDTERRYTAFNSKVSKAVKEAFDVDINIGDKSHEVLKAMDPSMNRDWENIYQSGFQGRPQRLLHEFSFHDQKIFFDVRLNPIQKDNKIIGLSCYAKDITHQMLYNEQLQKAIAKASIETKDKERNEIGRELHDNVKQLLATAKMYLCHALQYPVQGRDMIQKSVNIINSSIQELRRLSSSLVPPSLGDKSLKEKICELISDIEFIKGKFILHDFTTLNEEVLNICLKTSVFRIIQEQMNNILKHADATEVKLKIVQEKEMLELWIEDNGKGFDVKAKRNGIGIYNIINRAQTYNGTVRIDSEPGKGCKLYIGFLLK